MKMLAILALCAAAAMGANRATKAKEIDGVSVLPGPAFEATTLGKINALKFYTTTTEKDNAPCTVVTGTFISKLPTSEVAVELTIHFYNLSQHAGRIWNVGDITTTIQRPRPGVPITFAMLGPVSCKTPDKMRPIFDNQPLTNGYFISMKMVEPSPLEAAKKRPDF